MWRITDRARGVKGGYNYTVPESQRFFSAPTFSRLVLKVHEYQVANNYKVTAEAEMEDDWCKRHTHLCNDGTPKAAYVEHDDLLTRLAATVGIPAADALSKLTAKLGIHCRTCNKRHGIIRRVREIGFDEALRQLKETL